jgi:hypothetical protein
MSCQTSTSIVALLLLSPLAAVAQGPAAVPPAPAMAPLATAGLRPDRDIPGIPPTSAAGRQAILSAVVPVTVIKPFAVLKGDHLASGISLRNRGGGVINLRGIPVGSVPVKAYLWWDILGANLPAAMNVSINGVAVPGTRVGVGSDPYWGQANNFAYRASVPLYLLFNGINGDYVMAGFPSGSGTGEDPWNSPIVAPLAEGVTLLVIYRPPAGGFTATYLYDAPAAGQMFSGTWSTTLAGIGAGSSQAKFTLVGADGQIGAGLSAWPSITQEKSFFAGNQIAGPGGVVNDSDWNGSDTEPLNQLWDTRTHLVQMPNAGNPQVRYDSPSDALVIVAFALSR